MADRIVGYPPTVTVSGDFIIWAAGEFDKAIFDTFTITDYIIKTTGAPTTSKIASIGGLQADGTYQITVMPGHGFVTGDRCSPQVGNTTLTYTTIASAFVASISDGSDRLLLWYRNPTLSPVWYETISSAATTKAVSLAGMLAGNQVTIRAATGATNTYNLSGVLSGQTTQVVWENLFVDVFANTGLIYHDTSLTGAGVIVRRNVVYGGDTGIQMRNHNTAAGTIRVENNLVIHALRYGMQLRDSAGVECYNNTVIFSGLYGIWENDKNHTLKNNLVWGSGTADYNSLGAGSTLMSNWSSDATGTIGGTNKTRADIDFLWDEANGTHPQDFRVTTTAGVLTQGTVTGAPTLDIDGQTRPSTPSVGCSEGINFADYPAASDVESGVVFAGGAKTGTFVVPAISNVRDTISYGAGGAEFTGTFSCVGGTPASPVLLVVDAQNGVAANVTLSAAEVGSTNRVYSQSVSGGAWTLGATVIADASGNASATVSLAPGHYWAKVESVGATGTSVGNVVNFWVTGGGFESEEVRTYLRGRLAGDSTLTSLLASTSAVYHLAPSLPAAFPAIIYSLDLEGDMRLDTKGAFQVQFRVALWGEDAGTLNTLADQVERLLGDHYFSTTNWLCRRLRQAKSETRLTDFRLESGRPVLERALTYHLRVLRKGA